MTEQRLEELDEQIDTAYRSRSRMEWLAITVLALTLIVLGNLLAGMMP